MRLNINQPPRPRDRRVIRRRLTQGNAHETTQRQGIGQTPAYPTLTVDAFEVADQQRTEIDSRHKPGTAHLRRIELPAKTFHTRVELLLVTKFVQTLVERMTRRTAPLL